MTDSRRRLLVCNCEETMALDGRRLGKACGIDAGLDVNVQLCRSQIDNLTAAAAGADSLTIACTQEAPLFREVLAEAEIEIPATFVNIREMAGWSEQAKDAGPKIAALLSETSVDVPASATVGMRSEGVCLVYGRDERALEAAAQLSSRLDVTLLLTRPDAVIPRPVTDVPVFKGTIRSATGHLGAFEIVVDDYAPTIVSSRHALEFHDARNGALSKCELILDLSGGAPLFPAPDKRDGYFRPDPDNPAAIQKALFDLSDLVGEFEKPRYVNFRDDLCAHSRSGRVGCTRCLDVCPASAIAPAGDHVAIDPYVCGGCGACDSVCPTGAAEYAYPPASALYERLRTLLTTYHRAAGKDAEILIHDERHGVELISLMARFGRGLPANVLPFAVNEVTQVGFDLLMTAAAFGAGRVSILVPPQRRDELDGLAGQAGLAEAALSGLGYDSGRVLILTEEDPDAVEAVLYGGRPDSLGEPATFLPMGGKRNVIGLALAHLHRQAPEPVDILPLPRGAPFGKVAIDTDGCTLCLACVGACPTGALMDNPDRPQLSFQEAACIQCGLCRNTCPESVITLEPRLNFTEEARQATLVKEEEPFECVRCGKPFGTRSSIERIVSQLAGKHAMFMNPQVAERLRMCEDCRVVAQFDAGDDPMRGADRPKTRTTDDYLREAEIEAARARVLAERESGGNGEN